MCRWIAYRGETTSFEPYVNEPEHSLIAQSIRSLQSAAGSNGDGFGLGWYGEHDAVAIASLYRCLTRHLYQRPHLSKEVAAVERAIAVENKWRAQHYGTDCIFASQDGPVTISEWLSRIIDDITADSAALDCTAEVEHCRTIVTRGSSAEFQLRAYRESGDDITAASRWIAAASTSETRVDAGRRTQVPS